MQNNFFLKTYIFEETRLVRTIFKIVEGRCWFLVIILICIDLIVKTVKIVELVKTVKVKVATIKLLKVEIFENIFEKFCEEKFGKM